ncbi:MAG: galactokinase [Acidimicrobiia bacterium]
MSTKWRAPGRVNLIGDHTDYCEGFVLPMAIDRVCVLSVETVPGDRVRAQSLDVDGVLDVAADGHDEPSTIEPAWGRFVAGAVQVVTERGARLPGLELSVSSTVPAGSGLSSSSALAVALTLGLADAGGLEFDRRDAARAALDAEVRATGVPGGLMDQLASLFGELGHALLIDCRSLDVEPIPLPAQLAVLVVHSGLPRTLARSEYGERRAACERAATDLGVKTLRDATLEQVRDDPRARHVVTENTRVVAFADALRSGDVNSLGPILLASHASLRDDFEVSTPELDLLVELLVDDGAYGARLTGAGFGGCVVALCQRNRADNVLARTVERYQKGTGLQPSAFVARASAAARRSLDP